MKIVHICLCGTVTDGFTYQDNLLSKYHKRLGYDVTLIASQWIRGADGEYATDTRTNYINADGVKMIRLPMRGKNIDTRFKTYPGLYHAIENEYPDILFIHDCQFRDIRTIVRYKKEHPNVCIYVDNHADYLNSARGWISKNILHGIIWRHYAQMIAPYVNRFYGVSPVRVDFLTDLYGLDPSQCELLVMGADDDLVKMATRSDIRKDVRERYHIADDDFLIVSGGKINHWRPETLDLMQATAMMNRTDVRLLVFGNVAEELRERFDTLLQSPQITFAGWQNARGIYEILGAADLVVFPGLHSVMWEQAVGLGIPCIFRDIEGFHHIDLGGNAILLKDVSAVSLQRTITELVEDPARCARMRHIAETKGMKTFSYKDIARRSIGQ